MAGNTASMDESLRPTRVTVTFYEIGPLGLSWSQVMGQMAERLAPHEEDLRGKVVLRGPHGGPFPADTPAAQVTKHSDVDHGF